MDLDLLQRVLLPFLLAIAAAAIVGILRGFGSLGRLRLWGVITGFAAGGYLSLRGSGIPYEAPVLQVVSAIAFLAATGAVLRLVDLIFWDWFLSRRRHISVPRLAVDLFKLLTLVGVGIAILKYDFGMELSGLLVTSTVVSAIIGLAIQDMLANVAAGLGVQLEKPFSVGDWLLIGPHEGVVTQINWRTLTLLTRDRHEILVPNSTVSKTEVVNFCRPSTLQRVHTTVGLAYRHPPGVVKAALLRAATSSPEVAAAPPVEVLVKSFDDSQITYDVRFWIHDYGRLLQVLDDVNSRIWYELRRSDLTIPFPQRDVYMRTISDDQDRREAAQRSREIFAVLRPLPVFAPLADEQVEALVAGAGLQVYMDGEALVREGERGESLFVIRSGSVRIERSLPGGSSTTISRLGPGDFFGEMSLLTGEPRTASIVAESEVHVVVVSKDSFAPVLAADAGLLVGLSEALEQRQRDTAERLADLPDAPEQAEAVRRASPILRRIRTFFGIDEA